MRINLVFIPTACADDCVPTRNRMKCLHNSNSTVGTNRGVKQTPGTQRNQTHSNKSNRIQTIATQHIFSPSLTDQGADRVIPWKRPNQRIRTVEMSEEKKNKQTWGLGVRRGGIESEVPPAAPGGWDRRRRWSDRPPGFVALGGVGGRAGGRAKTSTATWGGYTIFFSYFCQPLVTWWWWIRSRS